MISDEMDARRRFKQQIAPLLPPLAQTVRFLVADEQAADGVLRETVQEAYHSYQGDLQDREFRRWIFERAIDDLSRHNTERYLRGAVDVQKEMGVVPGVSSYGGADDAESLRDLRRRVRLDIKPDDIQEAAESLPYQVRAVMALSLAAEFSHEEMAPVLKVPVAVVRDRLNEGRQLMRNALCERLHARRHQRTQPDQKDSGDRRKGMRDYTRPDPGAPDRR